MFYLPRYVDDLAFVAEVRQYLDEAVQKDVAGYEKEKRNSNRGEEPAGKSFGFR